ncbi:MAG: hypothetical protein K9H84_02385 [Bacteroidales bacterium]|nr:hypothetical protein [Bacteroidales bacterium]
MNWNENDISQEILEKINLNPLRLKWNITASREYYLPKNDLKIKGFADRLSRIDFRLTSIFLEQEFIYYIEAKRLKENDADLKRLYIKEGMDRFISEKYPRGCMLGYLLEGRTDKTIKEINKLIIKDSRNSEILKRKKSNLFKSFFESHHTEIGAIKHILLNYTDLNISI